MLATMVGTQSRKNRPSHQPVLPSRTSSSANNSSQARPITVIEISSSEDEEGPPPPVTKSKEMQLKSSSQEKRLSSKFKQPALDVSLWNVEPRIQPPKPRVTQDSSIPQHRPTTPSFRQTNITQNISSQPLLRRPSASLDQLPNSQAHGPTEGMSRLPTILSSSANLTHTQSLTQPILAESMSRPSTSDKASAHASQTITSSTSESIDRNAHAKELLKQRRWSSFRAGVVSTKDPASTPKANSSHQSLEPNGAASSSVRPIVDRRSRDQERRLSSSRKKDVINQLNSFSYSGRSTILKDQVKSAGPSASNNLSNSINQTNGKNHSQPSIEQCFERHNLSSSLPRKAPPLTSQPKHSSSVLSSTNPTSEQHRTRPVVVVPTSNVGHAQKGATELCPPSLGLGSSITTSCSTEIRNNGSTSLRTSSTQNANSSLNLSSEAAVHVHKKRKFEKAIDSNRITRENRFTELPELDHQGPIVSSASLPVVQAPSVAASLQMPGSSSMPTSKSKPISAVPCVMHPCAILPLPKIKPKVRPQSPDWTGIPLHRRPLQGRERPGEFSAEIQKTWILKNNPDLTTPLGHLIFSEEINSNQMWENPEIPPIDVVVPDEYKQKMFEDLRSGNGSRGTKSTGLDRSLAPPLEFVYTDRLVYRTDERPIPPNWHCNCHGDCLNNPNCECRAHQTSKVRQILTAMDMGFSENDLDYEGFAYTSTRKPRNSHTKKLENEDPEARCMKEMFIRGTFPVFECNSLCGCGPDCINRTVGRGRREKLSIEKTLTRGWGVFANHSIASGRLVTHYSGEIITDKMSLERGVKKYDKIGRTYIFDLDPWWINVIYSQNFDNEGLLVICEDNRKSNSVPGRSSNTTAARTAQDSNLPLPNTLSSVASSQRQVNNLIKSDAEVECIYSVDAFLYGNIARFINHSCKANTTIVPVYIEDSDPTRPIFAMFANKTIQTGKEITTSYSDPDPDDNDDGINVEKDKKRKEIRPDGHTGRHMKCQCGAPNCRGIMFA